jgi:hypothetical protein
LCAIPTPKGWRFQLLDDTMNRVDSPVDLDTRGSHILETTEVEK